MHHTTYMYTYTHACAHTQDQYEMVCTHTDSGIKYVKRVTAFVEERIHAELNYAKELR